jgi:outer membrane protein insertion porin family
VSSIVSAKSAICRVWLTLVVTVLVVALGAGPCMAQAPSSPDKAPIVEDVRIRGNRFIDAGSLLYYVSTKPGDRYDERRILADFRRLWETGFLDDMRVDATDGDRGKIITFTVKERRRILLIDFRGSKAVSKTTIEDKLKEKDATIKVDSFYDLRKVRKVEEIIHGLLLDAGRPFGKVRHETKAVGGAGLQLSFIVEDGPKTQIKQIVFLGNRVFSDGTLRHRMKLKERGFWNLSWILGSSTYTDEKWAKDQEKLQNYYLNHGYVSAAIGEPMITYYGGPSDIVDKGYGKYIRMEIPVSEGEQYRVGKLAIEGLTVLKPEPVRKLFKLREGDIYNESRIQKGYDKLRDLYGSAGYFNWTPLTKRKTNDEAKTVDVTLEMQEDKRYYVGRINFTGNDSTRDKVLRREMFLQEGGVFNTEALKLSIKRIDQLGFFKKQEEFPDLNVSSRGDDKVDVTFHLEEQNRNQITVGGGVSGYEGTFINSSFSTANFLGKGVNFQVSLQGGKRVKNYQLGFTQPYMFDRPLTGGINLYRRRLVYYGYGQYAGYVDDRVGGSVTSGYQIGGFTRVFGNYTYEVIKISQASEDELAGYYPYYGTGTGTVPITQNPAFGYMYDSEGRRRESRFSPSLVFNTVDNPWMPRSGVRFSATTTFAGGPLGGNMNYILPRAEGVLYIPHTRRTALGLHLDAAYIVPFGSTADVLPPDTSIPYPHDRLSFYNRFALGGETQVRGYPVYSIYADVINNVPLRGDYYTVFNAEYYLDAMSMLRFLLFFDAGGTFLKDEPFDVNRLKISYGAEMRFTMPVLNVPFRLIYARNPNLDAYHAQYWGVKAQEFKFAVGTTF